nr:MAG TPA: Regulatory protein-modification, helix-turn-helix, transcriptional regulator, DNA [Caudoviricetes sp.]
MPKTNKEKIAEISARIETVIECCATVPNNFAKVLGYSRAQTIYDILNKKCAPSYDFFNRFTDSEYSVIVNLRWLLNGEGEMWSDFMRSLPHEDQIAVVDDVNHGVSVSSYYVRYEKNKNFQQNNDVINKLFDNIQEKDLLIREQSKEIGRLQEQITQLKKKLQKTASDVNMSGTANVG